MDFVTLVEDKFFQPLFRKRMEKPQICIRDLTGEINCICFTKTFKEYKDFIKEELQ